MRLIPRRQPDRKPTGTPPVRPAYDPLGDADWTPPAAEPKETRTPVVFANGRKGEMVVVGDPFGRSTTPTPSTPPPAPDTPESDALRVEGTRALAQAWYGEKS